MEDRSFECGLVFVWSNRAAGSRNRSVFFIFLNYQEESVYLKKIVHHYNGSGSNAQAARRSRPYWCQRRSLAWASDGYSR